MICTQCLISAPIWPTKFFYAQLMNFISPTLQLKVFESTQKNVDNFEWLLAATFASSQPSLKINGHLQEFVRNLI